jgi:hypothetical protein
MRAPVGKAATLSHEFIADKASIQNGGSSKEDGNSMRKVKKLSTRLNTIEPR